jgi:hypothetical protein
MVGGLLQLVAFGAQDIYLSGNASVSFDKLYTHERFTNKDLLKEIMDYKGGINDIVYPDDYLTFFNKAIYYDFKKSLTYLLEHGADPTIKCEYFDDCFCYSIDNYHLETANILFKYGITNKRNLDNISHIGVKIFSCYDKGYLELTNYLIKNYNKHFLFNPNYRYDEIVYLVEHGAYINSEYRKILEDKSCRIVGDLNTRTGYYNEWYPDYDDEYSDSDESYYEYSDSDDEPKTDYSFYKYMEIQIDKDTHNKFIYIAKKLAQRRWTFVKCYTRWLSLHQRAVVSANHPNRLKKLGVFDVKE